MSYNLTTTLYNVAKNYDPKRHTVIFFDEHLADIWEDKYTNYYDIDLSEEELKEHKNAFNELKNKYGVMKIIVPFPDFLPELKNKNLDPEDYVRLEIFNYSDMATYVKKTFLEKHSEDIYDIAYESKFNEDEIVFVYNPIISERKIDVIVLEKKDSEFTACFLDRSEYHKFLPNPLSKNWWGMHQILTLEDFNKFKESGDKDRPIKDWNFIENENFVIVTR